ncbi:MAG: hypothetical protein HY901_12425 [Deltaproteobacteria bacterium]|nr:hypothetical protein [Deltaproteobacteria bacterium]
MDVKGISFLTRMEQITKDAGEDAWNRFHLDLVKRDPFFERTILATTLIPIEKYLDFSDAAVDAFAGGDKNTYWKVGENAALWALQNGPYRAILLNKDARSFVERSLPRLWTTHFTDGAIQMRFAEELIEVEIHDLPVHHCVFEFLVMGYIKKALELFGLKSVVTERLKGWDSPDGEIHYRFRFAKQ